MAPIAYEFRGEADGYRPQDRHSDGDKDRDRDRDRRRNGDRDRQPRNQFTFRFPKPTADRPLLSQKRETTPELLVGQPEGQDQPRFKFVQLDELTDSDEAEMEESSSENEDCDLERPRKKRAMEPVAIAPPAEQPKWSNPDPYTALPPPDETQVKRPDFVKLIRKARISATAAEPLVGGDAVTTNDDFISFGADDEDFEIDNAPPENAPLGPKVRSKQTEDVAAGKKRTRDDQIKVFTGKSGKISFNSEGDIVSVWKARPSDNGSPWLELMEPTMHIGTR